MLAAYRNRSVAQKHQLGLEILQALNYWGDGQTWSQGVLAGYTHQRGFRVSRALRYLCRQGYLTGPPGRWNQSSITQSGHSLLEQVL
jgi:hypothetical protein